MSHEQIEDAIIQIIADVLGQDPDEVHESLTETEGIIDSLHGVEVILAAEEKFGISIPDDALSPKVCSLVPELVQLIKSRMAA